MIYSATINRIIDGDTLVARLDLGLGIEMTKHIRLFGINAPELNTEEGKQAKAWLNDHLLFRVVNLDVDPKQIHDKYGRLLAVIFISGLNINQELISQGYATEYNGGKRATSPATIPTATLPLPTPKPG
jgi:micrococcal nuclease